MTSFQEQISEAVQAFVNAETRAERKEIVKARRHELLTDAADRMLAELGGLYGEGSDMATLFEDYRALLARCRKEGIEVAFAARLRPKRLQALLKALNDPLYQDDARRWEDMCREALKLTDRGTHPHIWAALQRELGSHLYEKPNATEDDLRSAIEHYQRALEVYTPQNSPTEWATVQYNLGTVYTDPLYGKSGDNIAQGIEHYRLALRIYSPEAFPADWADTQSKLGQAYERAGSVEEAIAYYHRALEVYTYEGFPEAWIETQGRLALAYEQVHNAERAIEHYHQLLGVYTRQESPEQWGRVHNNLGRVYESSGDREQAIKCYGQALKVYTYQESPAKWAEAHNMVGRAYERADNVKKAIEHYQQALRVYTREAFPVNWADIQNSLGLAYAKYQRGRQAQDIEQAIEYHKRALEVFTYEEFPYQWAMVHLNLGAVYGDRKHGGRVENIEQAIRHCRQALEVYTCDEFPNEWAMAHVNLGVAYLECPSGEQAVNIDRAIEHYHNALKAYTHEKYPQEWAMAQSNLGRAFYDRILGSRSENIEQAIEHYRQALEVFTYEGFPKEWGVTNLNLAVLYTEFDPEQALEYHQLLLKALNRKTMPERWAQVQANLGSTYAQRTCGEPADNLEKAIEHFQLALQAHTPASTPRGWATIHNNLGGAYADRKLGDPVENRAQALRHYQLALEVYTTQQDPFEYRRAKRSLGHLYFEGQAWEEARQAYNEAIEVGDAILSAAYTEAGRRAEVGETSRLYAQAAHCLLRLGRPAEAFLRLEQGKTRLLSEALALNDVDLSVLPDAQRRVMLEARKAVRELQAEMRLPPHTPARRENVELGKLLREATVNLNRLIESIRKDYPDFMPTGLDLPDILALIPPGGALVAPLVTSQGNAVFVIPHGARAVGAEYIIWLDALADSDLLELLQGPADEPESGGWMGAYFAFLNNRTEKGALQRWKANVNTFTGQLWDALMGPIDERLRKLELTKGAPVVLMPQGGLGLLPSHAAWREVDGAPRYFIDDYTVSFAPSAYALDASHRRLQGERRSGNTLLAVINPTSDLEYAPAEGVAVVALFAPTAYQVLRENEATQASVIAAVPGSAYLHFACHGFCDWQDAMHSGLVLAGDDPFELAEIISPRFDLSDTRLVTLSACETGLTEVRQPDQYIGLPTGFLRAGAPAVVSTLWAVEDLSTMLLMERFYTNHLGGMAPAAALRETQCWLRQLTAGELADRFERELTEPDAERSMSYEQASKAWQHFVYDFEVDDRPYDHPTYWAAFTFTGV